MVTRLIVSGLAFGVRVRRTTRSPTGGKLSAERAAMRDRERPPPKKELRRQHKRPEQKIGHGSFIASPPCSRPYAEMLERAVCARQGRVIRRWYFVHEQQEVR